MKVVPQSFYQNNKVEKVMVNGLSCILFKENKHSHLQNQRYLAAHALTSVLDGELLIEDDKGNISRVREGESIFLPKGIYYVTDLIPTSKPFRAMVYFFDESVINSFLSSFQTNTLRKIQNHLILSSHPEIKFFQDALLNVYKKRKYHHLTSLKLTELLHLIATTVQGKEFVARLKSLNQRKKRSIKNFMESHFFMPLTISDYAYLTGRSVSTFRRDFKTHFNQSPKKWLVQKRMERAKKILQDSDIAIQTLATEVGYENTSHFIKAFSKSFGISPKQYQMQSCSDLIL